MAPQKNHSKSLVVRHKKILTRGLTTAWLEAGSQANPLLIFLHGFPDDASVWENQINYFKEKFLVVAPFLRGVGQSTKTRDAARYGLFSGVLDLLEVIDHLDPQKKKKIFIVGHDIGSVYSWLLAHYLGARANALTIINGAHPLKLMAMSPQNLMRQMVRSWYMALFVVPVLPELLFKKFGKQLLPLIHKTGGLTGRSNLRLAKDLKHLVKHYRGIIKEIPKLFFQKLLSKLTCPVLSISALDDPFLVVTNLDELETFAENPTVRIVKGSHWLQQQNPEYVNRLLDDFMKL